MDKFSNRNVKLIDFDCTVLVGTPIRPVTSAEYTCPEVSAYVLRNEGSEIMLSNESFDIYSFGVTVLRMFQPPHLASMLSAKVEDREGRLREVIRGDFLHRYIGRCTTSPSATRFFNKVCK